MAGMVVGSPVAGMPVGVVAEGVSVHAVGAVGAVGGPVGAVGATAVRTMTPTTTTRVLIVAATSVTGAIIIVRTVLVVGLLRDITL